MTSTKVFVHLYAEIGSSEEAEFLGQKLLAILQAYAPVTLKQPYQYWKIPEYYGLEFDFAPDGSYRETFDALVALIPRNGDILSGFPGESATWQQTDSSVFLAEQVRWVHILLITEEEQERSSPYSSG
jgi:hypothetical protein